MFHGFHYPFSLRIPPRWTLIHGCLRCATVRLLMHSEDGLVPQCWRTWNKEVPMVGEMQAERGMEVGAVKAKAVNGPDRPRVQQVRVEVVEAKAKAKAEKVQESVKLEVKTAQKRPEAAAPARIETKACRVEKDEEKGVKMHADKKAPPTLAAAPTA